MSTDDGLIYSRQVQEYWLTYEGSELLALYLQPELRQAIRLAEEDMLTGGTYEMNHPLLLIRPDLIASMFRQIFGHLFNGNNLEDNHRQQMLYAHLFELLLLDVR